MTTTKAHTSIRQQKGAALFFALMFLVVISIIALSATKSSLLQERMTGAVRNQQLALMGAETVLRGGEQNLWQLSFDASQPLPPCQQGSTYTGLCVYQAFYDKALIQAFRTQTGWVNFSGGGIRPYRESLTGLGSSQITAKLAREPMFLLEEMGPDVAPSAGKASGAVYPESTSLVGKRMFYRVFGRSPGGNDNAVSVAESVYSAMDLTNTGFNPSASP